jgi:hypothetical protein
MINRTAESRGCVPLVNAGRDDLGLFFSLFRSGWSSVHWITRLSFFFLHQDESIPTEPKLPINKPPSSANASAAGRPSDDDFEEADYRHRHNIAWALAVPRFQSLRKEVFKNLRMARDMPGTPDEAKVRNNFERVFLFYFISFSFFFPLRSRVCLDSEYRLMTILPFTKNRPLFMQKVRQLLDISNICAPACQLHYNKQLNNKGLDC